MCVQFERKSLIVLQANLSAPLEEEKANFSIYSVFFFWACFLLISPGRIKICLFGDILLVVCVCILRRVPFGNHLH